MIDRQSLPRRAKAVSPAAPNTTTTVDVEGEIVELDTLVRIANAGETVVLNWVLHLEKACVTSSESALITPAEMPGV